jgi:Ser/Thr protein kinase RdoA (MazF antagonist)
MYDPAFSQTIAALWGLEKEATITPFGTGLINHTWKVQSGGKAYILQRINQEVFRQPEAIAQNISRISQHLSQHAPQYRFVAPVKTTAGAEMSCDPERGCLRLFPFVAGSHSIDVVHTTKQAYEAAKAFGQFTRLLDSFDAASLQTTIPHFHDLSLRFQQFEAAVEKGNQERLRRAPELFQTLMHHRQIVDEYERIKKNPDFRMRVTHHDTKISNVLFDDTDNALCVIDLDTLMPGYFISDVGDMMRTYLSPAGEEERDFSKIEVRVDFFKAIVSGYLHQMNDALTDAEKESFVYAGKFLIYMQALRFFSDHLNNDVYYGAAYEGQNLVRAQNQVVLLQRLCAQESALQALVQEVLAHPAMGF